MEEIVQAFLKFYHEQVDKTQLAFYIIFVQVYVLTTIVDFITGFMLSVVYHKEPTSSSKIGATVAKIFSLAILSVFIIFFTIEPTFGKIVRLPAYWAMFLMILREVVSIMENLSEMFHIGHWPMYEFLKNLYDVLLGRFFTKIKDGDFDDNDDVDYWRYDDEDDYYWRKSKKDTQDKYNDPEDI